MPFYYTSLADALWLNANYTNSDNYSILGALEVLLTLHHEPPYILALLLSRQPVLLFYCCCPLFHPSAVDSCAGNRPSR